MLTSRASSSNFVGPIAPTYSSSTANAPNLDSTIRSATLGYDMHDCSVATGDAWLGTFLRPLLRSSVLGNAAVLVVFDEGTSSDGGGGHVPALVLGPLVRPGSQNSTPLDHYGLLRTIESAWHLPLLGRSRGAALITGIWR